MAQLRTRRFSHPSWVSSARSKCHCARVVRPPVRRWRAGPRHGYDFGLHEQLLRRLGDSPEDNRVVVLKQLGQEIVGVVKASVFGDSRS